MKTEIVPAIMPDDYNELVIETGRMKGLVSWIQIDVMDGKYTNSISWPYGQDKTLFEEIVNGDEGLPHWQDFNFGLDLMVSDPYTEAPKWLQAGAARIILHFQSLQKKGIDEQLALIQEIKDVSVEVCVAKVPSDDIADIEPLLEYVDAIQFMGIERVGYQGEPFVPSVVEDIADFHKKYPDTPIAIDGGVSDETAKLFVEAGANRLISGSFILRHEEGPEEAISLLQND